MNSNEQKFERLVKSLSNELYRFAYNLCHSSHQAEDLVQETFARAWKSLDQLKDSQAARAWLYTILRREHARLYQRQRPETRAPEDLPDIATESYDTSADAFALRQAMKKLPEEYRTSLVLQVVGGFSCSDIAQIQGISTSAVMTRLYRARNMLKNKLSPKQKEGRHELSRI